MAPSRAPSPNAPRRGPSHLRTIGLVIALVVAVAAMGVAPELVSGQAAIAIEQDPPSIVPTTPIIERIAAASTTTTPATTTTTAAGPQAVQVVADPRLGDLRTDVTADVLPVDYQPTTPHEIRPDQAYGPDPFHRYDLYLPEATAAPLIVFLHSGGWIGGTRSFVPDMVLRFLDHGYAIASVEYRVAPGTTFPGPVEDVKRAIRELKAMGAESGLIDPERVVVYGTSAGGHLGLFAATTVGEFEPTDLSPDAAELDSSVAAVVSAVGPTDLVQMFEQPNAWAAPMSGTFMGCFPTCTPDQLRPANPAEYLHAGIPPAYFAYGALDPLVDLEAQGIAIAEAWAAAGGESHLDVVDDGDHNLDETAVNQRALEAFIAAAIDG